MTDSPQHKSATLCLTDQQISNMISHLRGTGWGRPASNPAADALASIYVMLMECSDTDAIEEAADQAVSELRAYVEKCREDDYWTGVAAQ